MSNVPFFANETAGWISPFIQDPKCHKTKPKIVFDTDFNLQVWAGTFLFKCNSLLKLANSYLRISSSFLESKILLICDWYSE